MSSRRQSFTAGVLAVAPMIAGVIPFGLVFGLTAMAVGLTGVQAILMSVSMFAGASQLAALQLLAEDAVPVIIVLTALTINLRFLMYSASLAPHVYHLGPRWRLLIAYFLVDQNYAMSIHRFQFDDQGSDPYGHWHFLGGGLAMWLSWHAATLTGIYLGGRIPSDWSLDFAIPLMFMAVMILAVRHRYHVVAALIGGVVATVAGGVPYNLGLVIGALSGISAGVLLESWRNTAP